VSPLAYAMRFTGQTTPDSADGSVLTASATAPSSVLTSTVGPDGLAGTLRSAPGGEAVFESEVTFTGETSFQERGTIAFGNGHRLRFSTVGSGYLGPTADPSRRHGSVMWRIDGGDGQFAGASGLITSNFLVGEDFAVTDYHFGVIFIRERAVGR
jgi:hypothetical protein